MARLVPFGLTPKDRPSRRIRFSSVNIGRCFYYKGHWWQRRTVFTARRADCDDDDSTRFSKGLMVYVLAEECDASNIYSMQQEQKQGQLDREFEQFMAPAVVDDP